MDVVIGILLIVMAVFLVVAVLLQSGKSAGLSGSIAGGAETFFGKEKGKTMDKVLSKLTTIVAIVFSVVVLFAYLIQDDASYANNYKDYLAGLEATQTESGDAVDTGAAAESTSEKAE